MSFLENVIKDVSSRYKVDSKRVYITGFSNGAMMAHRMLSEKPELFASGAMVSGTVGGSVYENPPFTNKKPAQKKPVLLIHGEDDTTVPIKGGKNEKGDGNFFSFTESTRFWTENNGCSEIPSERDDQKIHSQEYKDCQVLVYTLKHSGHTWPGHPLSLKPSFHTSKTIWEFLSS